jgi:hypothetical protein
MPRVTLSDSLYEPTTDKVLPQLPQLPQSTQPEIDSEVTPEIPISPTIRIVSNASSTKENVANSASVRPPTPAENVPYEEFAWQEFYINDQKLAKWNLSTSLKAAMDQTETQLSDISKARIKYDCLISLCKGMLEINNKLQTPCLRAVDQHQAFIQKEIQLRNASAFVLEQNDISIAKYRVFLTDTDNSYHNLQAEYEKTLAHAKESSVFQSGKQVSKRDDLCQELEFLKALNKDISTVIENIIAINGLLDSHKHTIDTQVANLNKDIIKLASKRGSSILRKMLCFQ